MVDLNNTTDPVIVVNLNNSTDPDTATDPDNSTDPYTVTDPNNSTSPDGVTDLNNSTTSNPGFSKAGLDAFNSGTLTKANPPTASNSIGLDIE